MFAHLRQLLATIYEQTAISIGLEDKGYGIRVADKYDKSLIASATFILVVRADIAEETLRSRLPQQMKIGPVENIRQLINSALNGVCSFLDLMPSGEITFSHIHRTSNE